MNRTKKNIILTFAGMALLGVTALLAFQNKPDEHRMLNEINYDIILEVEGLHCSRCVRNCERSLDKLEPVEGTAVKLEEGLAFILLKDEYEVTKQEIITAIEDAGFKVGEFKRFPEIIDQ